MIKEKCKFCNSTALVYHHSFHFADSKCEECGEWQEGEEIK